MKRILLLLLFLAGLPVAMAITALMFSVAIPVLFYSVLWETDVPDPFCAMSWWAEAIRKLDRKETKP